MRQVNVTRVCNNYVPASCSEVCLQQTMEAYVAAMVAGPGSNGRNARLVAAVVPPVVIGSGGVDWLDWGTGVSSYVDVIY